MKGLDMYQKFKKFKDLNQFIELNENQVINFMSGLVIQYERISKSKITAGLDSEAVYLIDFGSQVRKKLSEAELYKVYKVFLKQSKTVVDNTPTEE